jgi:hypothetical protein
MNHNLNNLSLIYKNLDNSFFQKFSFNIRNMPPTTHTITGNYQNIYIIKERQ